MTHQIQIMPRAQADVWATCEWLAQHFADAAEEWYSKVMQEVQRLAENPERFPLADEAHRLKLELRQLTFGKRRGTFRVLFVIDGEKVNVLRIVRAARAPLKPGDLR